MRIFTEEGVDPRRCMIAHTGDTDDLDHIEELLALGPYIGMDRYGTDDLPARRAAQRDRRRALPPRLRGPHGALAGRVRDDRLVPRGADRAARAELELHASCSSRSSTQLRGLGVSDADIDTMLDETPMRWLAGD